MNIAKIFNKHCSCPNKLGAAQWLYEQRLAASSLRPDAASGDLHFGAMNVAVLNELEWTRFCCRTNAINASVHPIRNQDGRYYDETTPQPIVRDPPAVQLQRELPNYPVLAVAPGRPSS